MKFNCSKRKKTSKLARRLRIDEDDHLIDRKPIPLWIVFYLKKLSNICAKILRSCFLFIKVEELNSRPVKEYLTPIRIDRMSTACFYRLKIRTIEVILTAIVHKNTCASPLLKVYIKATIFTAPMKTFAKPNPTAHQTVLQYAPLASITSTWIGL